MLREQNGGFTIAFIIIVFILYLFLKYSYIILYFWNIEWILHQVVKRVWTPSEDERLVEFLVELCVLGKLKWDNGFKLVTFLQVEKWLEEKFLNSGLKASPHIESCMMTLKRQCNAIMDILTHDSRFSRVIRLWMGHNVRNVP